MNSIFLYDNGFIECFFYHHYDTNNILHWECRFTFDCTNYILIVGPNKNLFLYLTKAPNKYMDVFPQTKTSPQTVPEALRMIKLLALS